MDWSNVGQGVDQLLELIDDHNMRDYDDRLGRPRFTLDHIVIRPSLRSDKDSGEIVAYDPKGKLFHYFIIVTHDGQLIADGVS